MSSSRFTKIRPDAPPSTGQKLSVDALVNRALNEIDSPEGPIDPSSRVKPLYPGWVRMSTQEKIRAVIDAMDQDPAVARNIGPLTISFEKTVRDEYEKKHRRNR